MVNNNPLMSALALASKSKINKELAILLGATLVVVAGYGIYQYIDNKSLRNNETTYKSKISSATNVIADLSEKDKKQQEQINSLSEDNYMLRTQIQVLNSNRVKKEEGNENKI